MRSKTSDGCFAQKQREFKLCPFGLGGSLENLQDAAELTPKLNQLPGPKTVLNRVLSNPTQNFDATVRSLLRNTFRNSSAYPSSVINPAQGSQKKFIVPHYAAWLRTGFPFKLTPIIYKGTQNISEHVSSINHSLSIISPYS